MSELSFPKELEPFDYMMLRSEHEPRARSGFLAVSLLESVPDFERLRGVYDRASRAVNWAMAQWAMHAGAVCR